MCAVLSGAGEVAYMHFSPPCQAISSVNAHLGFDRYKEQLVPLMEQVTTPLFLPEIGCQVYKTDAYMNLFCFLIVT